MARTPITRQSSSSYNRADRVWVEWMTEIKDNELARLNYDADFRACVKAISLPTPFPRSSTMSERHTGPVSQTVRATGFFIWGSRLTKEFFVHDWSSSVSPFACSVEAPASSSSLDKFRQLSSCAMLCMRQEKYYSKRSMKHSGIRQKRNLHQGWGEILELEASSYLQGWACGPLLIFRRSKSSKSGSTPRKKFG